MTELSILEQARARSAGREVTFQVTDYARMNREFPKQKAALTRALKTGDPNKVAKACKDAVTAWNAMGAWPDDWSHFQRALDDTLGWGNSVLLEDL